MKLHTPGERYVTLGSMIRVFLECVLIMLLNAASGWEFSHGYVLTGAALIAAAACGLMFTVLLAPTRWRR